MQTVVWLGVVVRGSGRHEIKSNVLNVIPVCIPCLQVIIVVGESRVLNIEVEKVQISRIVPVLVWALSRTLRSWLDPSWPLVVQGLERQRTRDLDHRPICERAKGRASRSCSLTWPRYRNTEIIFWLKAFNEKTKIKQNLLGGSSFGGKQSIWPWLYDPWCLLCCRTIRLECSHRRGSNHDASWEHSCR